MIEKIFPGLYKIEIPLPKNPLKALNSYVFEGKEKNLIVDTGMNREECKDVMFSGLREIGIDLENTDFFITHMHADHSGLVSSLASDSAKIYCSEIDAGYINIEKDHWEKIRVFAKTGGFPEKELQEAINRHPGYKYSVKEHINFSFVKENDAIEVGDYHFYCVETPGHTKGHVCLYERDKKLFLSGDHILGNITPNISLIRDEGKEDPLGSYIKSLNKVYDFEIETVLPGHRTIIKDHKERINELKKHHLVRAEEVLSILSGKGWKSAYEVASEMTWDMTYESFEIFPVSQKWFATGEALAHLKYLEEKGMVRKELQESCNKFAVTNGGESSLNLEDL